MQRCLKKKKLEKKYKSDDREKESSEPFLSESLNDSGLDNDSKIELQNEILKIKMKIDSVTTDPNEDPFVFWAPFDKQFKEESKFSLLNNKMRDSMLIDLEDQVTAIPNEIVGSLTPFKYFEIYFPDSFIEHIIFQTNLYAEQSINKMKKENRLFKYSRVNRWTNVTKDDLRKYIGIVLWTGLISNKDISGN